MLTEPAGRTELNGHLARVMVRPLRRDRPLRRIHVITGLTGGDVAVLFMLHHTLADGAKAMLVGLGLLDRTIPAPGTAAGTGDRPGPGSARGAVEVGWELLTQPDQVLRCVWAAANRVPDAVRDAGRAAGIIASAMAATRLAPPRSPLLSTPPPSSSPPPGRAVATTTVSMGQVRAVRRLHGGTCNDVLLAVVAGALRDWHTTRGGAPHDWGVRALVPVSTRRRSGDDALGNQVSGYLCELPVVVGVRNRQVHADAHRA